MFLAAYGESRINGCKFIDTLLGVCGCGYGCSLASETLSLEKDLCFCGIGGISF
jgi:hypothetical protein